MTSASEPVEPQFCYLTTTGRVSGRRHTIEIWFAIEAGSLYMLAGNHDSDWVRNLRREATVTVRIGERTFGGRARVVSDAAEDGRARRLLLAKYRPESADDLSGWGRDALPVAVDLGAESGQV